MNIEYAKDNKEQIPFTYYLEEFRKLDPKEASNRTGVAYDAEKQEFHLFFLQMKYAIAYPEFSVRKLFTDEVGFDPVEDMIAAKIMIIRFLTKGVLSQGSGNFLTYREVPWGEVYFKQFQGRCLMRLAFSYGSRLEVFGALMEKLGAKKLDFGDASYELEIMEGYAVRFILWSGDEEFPPSSQILFSDNFPLSFEAEDLAVVGDISMNTLKKMM